MALCGKKNWHWAGGSVEKAKSLGVKIALTRDRKSNQNPGEETRKERREKMGRWFPPSGDSKGA